MNALFEDEEIQNHQSLKHAVVKALVKEGFLSNKDADYFLDRYIVVFSKSKWYERAYNKIFGSRNKNGLYYDIVKFISTEDDDISNDNIDSLKDLEILKEKLIEASKNENFELAEKISKRIKYLENQ